MHIIQQPYFRPLPELHREFALPGHELDPLFQNGFFLLKQAEFVREGLLFLVGLRGLKQGPCLRNLRLHRGNTRVLFLGSKEKGPSKQQNRDQPGDMQHLPHGGMLGVSVQ